MFTPRGEDRVTFLNFRYVEITGIVLIMRSIMGLKIAMKCIKYKCFENCKFSEVSGVLKTTSGSRIYSKDLTGFRSYYPQLKFNIGRGYRSRSAKEKCTWSEVQETPGVNFQVLPPSGIAKGQV